MLRPGNAGYNIAAEHIEAVLALAGCSAACGGDTYEFLGWLPRPSCHLHYSTRLTPTTLATTSGRTPWAARITDMRTRPSDPRGCG